MIVLFVIAESAFVSLSKGKYSNLAFILQIKEYTSVGIKA